MTMPTDEERREYPHLSEAGWEGVERMRALKARGEFPFSPLEPVADWQDLVLEQLRQQTVLLGKIADLLAEGDVANKDP
jgi:hypothetical protein